MISYKEIFKLTFGKIMLAFFLILMLPNFAY